MVEPHRTDTHTCQFAAKLASTHINEGCRVVQRSSPARERRLARLGENIRKWRQLQGMSASEMSRRAHITRDTLRKIENGTGSPRIDSLIAVITVLGFADHFIASADPFTTDAGRSLALDRARVKS
ncbi:helix-turn-helix domain-containing protein [Leucobacter manosquensis]